MITKVRIYTARFNPLWSIIGAPIIQEPLFRFIPYYFFYTKMEHYWEIGITSSFLYSLIHWYFGWRIVLYTFALGLLFWWIMVNFGLFQAILAHSLANIFIRFWEVDESK